MLATPSDWDCATASVNTVYVAACCKRAQFYRGHNGLGSKENRDRPEATARSFF